MTALEAPPGHPGAPCPWQWPQRPEASLPSTARGLPPCSSCVPQHQLNRARGSCLTPPGLQYPGRWISCGGSKDKLEIKKKGTGQSKLCGLCCTGPCPALSFWSPLSLRGSRGCGLAWLCRAQPAHWAGLGTQVFHSGVMWTPEKWCQTMILFLQTTGVVRIVVRT